MSVYAQLTGISGRVSDNGGEGVRRHCGKSAPEDLVDGDSAVELVFRTNQGDACKGFAFQYRVETSNAAATATNFSNLIPTRAKEA